MCVMGLQCGRYTRRKNPVQHLVAYVSAHGHSLTHEKISQQQYSTFGNDLFSFLQTNSNSNGSELCVYVQWAGYNGYTGQYLYTVYQDAEGIWCCDETLHDLEPPADGMRDAHEDMEYDSPAFSLISHRSSKGHNVKSSQHRL